MRYKRCAPACLSIVLTCPLVALLCRESISLAYFPTCCPLASLARLLEKVEAGQLSPAHRPSSHFAFSLTSQIYKPLYQSDQAPKCQGYQVTKCSSVQLHNKWSCAQLLQHSRMVIRGLIDCSLQTTQEPLNLGMVDQALRKSKSEWSCPEWISILLTMERLTCLLCKGSPPTSLSSLVHNLNSLLHNPLQCPVPFCNQVFTSVV